MTWTLFQRWKEPLMRFTLFRATLDYLDLVENQDKRYCEIFLLFHTDSLFHTRLRKNAFIKVLPIWYLRSVPEGGLIVFSFHLYSPPTPQIHSFMCHLRRLTIDLDSYIMNIYLIGPSR